MKKLTVKTRPLFKLYMIAAVSLYLSACASKHPPAEIFDDDEFSTEITQDGTKFFTYIRHMSKDAKHAEGLRGAVELKLDTSGYCRDGYLDRESYHANGIARLRGECREGASTQDRKQFPNR